MKRPMKRQVLVAFVLCLLFVSLMSPLVFLVPNVEASQSSTVTQILFVNSMSNASTQWQTQGNSPYLNNASGTHSIYMTGQSSTRNYTEGNFGFAHVSVMFKKINSAFLYIECKNNASLDLNAAYVYNASGTYFGLLQPSSGSGIGYSWQSLNVTRYFNTTSRVNHAFIYFKYYYVIANKLTFIDRTYLNVTGTVYPQTSRDNWAQMLWNNDTAAGVNSTFPFVRLGSNTLTFVSQEELLTGALLAAQTGDNSSLLYANRTAVWLNQTSIKKHVWFTYNSTSGWQITPITPTPGTGVIERLAVYAYLVPKWEPLLQQIVNEWIRIYLPLSTARVHLEVWPNDTVYKDPLYAGRDYCIASYQSSGIIALTLASAVLHNTTLQNLAYRMIMNYTNYDPVRAPHHLSTHAIYPNGTLDLNTYYFSKEDEDYANYMAAMETFYYYYPQNTTVKSRIFDQAWDGAQNMWNSTGQCWNYRTDIRSGSLDTYSGPPYVAVHGFGMTDEVLLGAYLIFGNTTWRDRARQDFDSLVAQGRIIQHGLINHSTNFQQKDAHEAWNVYGRRTGVILYNLFGNQTYLKLANMLFWNVTGQMAKKYGLAEAIDPTTGLDVPPVNTRETLGEFLAYVNKTVTVPSFHSLFKTLGLPITGIIPPPPPKWLSVTLNGPNGKSQTSLSATFFYTPYVVATGLQNASLWTNSSGVWQRVTTDFAPLNLTQNSISYTYGSYGLYEWNVKVYNSTLGVFASSSYTISLMSVSVSPASVVMDKDQSKLFTSSIVGGFSPFTYQWYLNSAPVSGATSSSWLFTPPSPGSYNVYVNATDNTGTRAKSNVVIVTVNPPPSVTISPTSVVMDVGQSKLFTSNATGGTIPFSYQWYLNDAPVPGAKSSSWLFPPTSAASYTIFVNVTDYVGVTAKSNIALVTVNPPPEVNISPDSTTLDVGQSQLLTSHASGGTPPYSYRWYLNGIPVLDATNSTWTFTPASSGYYTVYVELTDDVEMTVASNTATVTVNPPPSITISPSSVVIDADGSQLFTSSLLGGTNPFSYQWYLDGSPVSGATSPTWTYMPSSAGFHTVYLIVTDDVSVSATSNTVPITVNEALSVSISPSSAVFYVGQPQLFTSNLTGGTSPYIYQWFLNDAPVSGATSPTWTFTPMSIGAYTVYLEIADSVGMHTTSSTANVTVTLLKGHDVAVASVTTSKTVVGQGFSISINATVADYGSYDETFQVSAYVNAVLVASQNITLASGNSATLIFVWNTASFAYGNYTISAYAWPVPGDANMANNNFTDGMVKVTIPGDMNGDGVVNIADLHILGVNWGLTVPPGDPRADINGDGKVGTKDLQILGANWNRSR